MRGSVRFRSMLVVAMSLYLFFANQPVFASPGDTCALPSSLRDELSKKYPESRLVGLADLTEYDRKLFQKDHGTHCPGAAKVNFYGDGKPTWALVLISGEDTKRKAELVVGRQVEGRWELRSLEATDGTPVVWREGPGKYDGFYGDKTIQAKRPVIVFCGLESWAIVYIWTGKKVEKVQVSD